MTLPLYEREGLDFPPIGGKKQRHASALIGAGVIGCTAPGLETPHKCQEGFKTA